MPHGPIPNDTTARDNALKILGVLAAYEGRLEAGDMQAEMDRILNRNAQHYASLTSLFRAHISLQKDEHGTTYYQFTWLGD